MTECTTVVQAMPMAKHSDSHISYQMTLFMAFVDSSQEQSGSICLVNVLLDPKFDQVYGPLDKTNFDNQKGAPDICYLMLQFQDQDDHQVMQCGHCTLVVSSGF